MLCTQVSFSKNTNSKNLDVVYSKVAPDKKINGTNITLQTILSSKDMTKFLSIIEYSNEDAKTVLTNQWKSICSNVDFIANEKKFELVIKKDVLNTVSLICAMVAILEKRLGLDKLNITQNDILSIVSIESKFDKSAKYGGAYGLFQINLSTIKDVIENFDYIKSDISTISDVSCYDISKIGLNDKNYFTNLLEVSNSIALFGLVLFRKYKIALQDARETINAIKNKNSKDTNSYLYQSSKKAPPIKKRNILFNTNDPRTTGNYKLNEYQKEIFFADYYNASADLRKIKDYGKEYAEHASLLDKHLDKYVFSN